MSDDEFGDLLEELETNQPAPAKVPEKLIVTTTPKRSVNFPEEPKMRAAGRSTNALSDLFGDTPAPRRTNTNIDDLFGTKPSATTAPAPAVVPPSSAPVPTAPQENFDAGRILRLETELERVNRELEDTKRKKREDEEDLENFWKTKLEVQIKDNSKNLEELKNSHKIQISKLQEEHHLELERLKTNFDRQLENVTSSAGQVGDLVAVVGKVDAISTNIDKIAADVVASTNKVSAEQTTLLQLQEERLKMKEDKLNEDLASLKIEQFKVQELNLSLRDLVKNQQDEVEKEKWKFKEEWNRLKAERQIFKENQERIVENVQKEKISLAKSVKAFHESQHELLFRVSTERQLLEKERSEFFAKRDQDIKRIKSEAYELDLKIQQISNADQHLTEMRMVNETKFRQLQHLETLLTAECAEIERIRNEQKVHRPEVGGAYFPDTGRRSNNSNENSHRRSESVRASLKKHYDHLEKYAGQKVAAVAPQNN